MDVDNEPSCARTDARHVDRTQQIKYDVAKNDDHLKRTTKKQLDSHPLSPSHKGKEKAGVIEQTPYTVFDERVTAERHSGLDERLSNVETHFSVTYGMFRRFFYRITESCSTVPSPPSSLLVRLKMLEDHIIRLEKEYPPWAALHFNQPNRDVSIIVIFLNHPSDRFIVAATASIYNFNCAATRAEDLKTQDCQALCIN